MFLTATLKELPNVPIPINDDTTCMNSCNAMSGTFKTFRQLAISPVQDDHLLQLDAYKSMVPYEIHPRVLQACQSHFITW